MLALALWSLLSLSVGAAPADLSSLSPQTSNTGASGPTISIVPNSPAQCSKITAKIVGGRAPYALKVSGNEEGDWSFEVPVSSEEWEWLVNATQGSALTFLLTDAVGQTATVAEVIVQAGSDECLAASTSAIPSENKTDTVPATSTSDIPAHGSPADATTVDSPDPRTTQMVGGSGPFAYTDVEWDAAAGEQVGGEAQPPAVETPWEEEYVDDVAEPEPYYG